MSKIIDFPQALRAVEPETLSVDRSNCYTLADLGEGALDLSNPDGLKVTPHLPVRSTLAEGRQVRERDWSNQELASFYRAHRLLNLTGISFDVDRGLSDEGDPWFVFLDEADQVFVHFCRIDGTYYLDSTADGDCVLATSLDALIGNFARRGEVLKETSMQQNAASDVIEFKRPLETKVLMHPGVSLAALVWSLYVLSDGLILPLWKQQGDTSGPSGDLNIQNVQTNGSEHFQLLPEVAGTLQAVEKDQVSLQNTALLQTSDLRDAQSAGQSLFSITSGMTALNAIALGLTAISASYGIAKLTSPLSLTTSEDGALEATSPQKNSSNATESFLGSADLFESLAQLLITVPQSAPRDTDEKNQTGVASNETEKTHTLLEDIEAIIVTLQEAHQIVDFKEVGSEAPVEIPSNAIRLDIGNDTEVGQVQNATAIQKQEYAALSDQSFFQKLFEFDVIEAGSLRQLANAFTAEDVSLMGSIEIDTADDGGLSFSVEEPLKANGHLLFDANALEFINHLLMKDEEPQRSAYNEEVIIIDMTAFDGTGGDVYARSWFFEDGSVLSTIGLKSDFEAFGLVV